MLSDAQLWAEHHLIRHELARVIFTGGRPTIVNVDPSSGVQTLQQWLEVRLRRIEAERTRRRQSKPAAAGQVS